MKQTISKEDITSIQYDSEKEELTINWWTGGAEKAVCGIVLKVKLEKEIISNYKAPDDYQDLNHDRAF